MQDNRQKYQDELDRINNIADKEAKVRVKIENQLRGVIRKLEEELKYVKIILRYPKLYMKYKEHKFDHIKEGLLMDDLDFLKKEVEKYQNLETSQILTSPQKRLKSPKTTILSHIPTVTSIDPKSPSKPSSKNPSKTSKTNLLLSTFHTYKRASKREKSSLLNLNSVKNCRSFISRNKGGWVSPFLMRVKSREEVRERKGVFGVESTR